MSNGKISSPLLGLLIAAALTARPEQDKPSSERPINRKPLSRKLECPDYGQEVLLVRTLTDGTATIDVHFLFDDGEHMVAGLVFPSVVDRDSTFMKLTYEDTKGIFQEMMSASIGTGDIASLLATALGQR